MHEIERKFLLLQSGAQIERGAAESGSLASRRLIQQRYLAPAGWRLRAKSIRGAFRTVRTISLKRRAGERIDFTIDEKAWDRLVQVAEPARGKTGDAPGTVRLRMDDLSDWTIRLRRSTNVGGQDVRCYLTMKRKVTMMRCVEIESRIPEAQHQAALPYYGPAVRKRRICVRHAGRTWEVDVFLNPELMGIEVVEIELPCESVSPSMPTWVGREVTQERAYKNAKLVKQLAA